MSFQDNRMLNYDTSNDDDDDDDEYDSESMEHSGLDDSIQITASGYPRMVNAPADLDIVVLEGYENELLTLLFQNEDFRETYQFHVLDALPFIKQMKIRDDYVAIVFRYDYQNSVSKREAVRAKISERAFEVLQNLFEKKPLPVVDLVEDEVDAAVFNHCLFEQLALNTKRFYFGYEQSSHFIFGYKGHVDPFIISLDHRIEYRMDQGVNVIRAFAAYQQFLAKFTSATGSQVHHDSDANVIEVTGLYANCAYFCAFVQCFMRKLDFVNTFLSAEKAKACEEHLARIETKLAEIGVYFNAVNFTLWSLDARSFENAKRIIANITGIEFEHDRSSVTRAYNKIVMNYLKMWDSELKERFKGLDISVVFNESNVTVSGVNDGIECFLRFLGRITEKKVEFPHRDFDDDDLKEDLNCIRNICFEIFQNYVVFIGPDEDVDDACFVIDEFFKDTAMEQSVGANEIALTEEKCESLFFLFRDDELFKSIRQEFLDDEIIRDFTLSADSTKVTFLLNNSYIKEHDLIVALDTRIKNQLYQDHYVFEYPKYVPNDENNNALDEFVNEMKNTYSSRIKEKLLENVDELVQVESVTCTSDGKADICYMGTKQGVMRFKEYLNSMCHGEVIIGDRHLLKDLDTGLVKEWNSVKEKKAELEVQPVRSSVTFAGSKAIVVFLEYYLIFLRENLTFL